MKWTGHVFRKEQGSLLMSIGFGQSEEQAQFVGSSEIRHNSHELQSSGSRQGRVLVDMAKFQPRHKWSWD